MADKFRKNGKNLYANRCNVENFRIHQLITDRLDHVSEQVAVVIAVKAAQGV